MDPTGAMFSCFRIECCVSIRIGNKSGLIVFGGVGGIEEIVESDESLSISRDECHTLFDLWVNTCP